MLHNLPFYLKRNKVGIFLEKRKKLLKKNKLHSQLAITLVIFFFLFQTVKYFNQSGFLVGDLGRELYSPLRILQGQKVYKDFLWLYGPFSLWLNALVYKFLGISISSLYYLSLVLSFLIGVITFKIAQKLTGTLLATLITILFIKISMFGFTWQSLILPGKFSLLWALLFSLLIISNLINPKKENLNFWLIGVLLGLTTITKIDYAFATLVLVSIYFIVNINLIKIKNISKILAGSGMIIGSSIFYLTFSQKIPPSTILENILPAYASSFWFYNRPFYDSGVFFSSLLITLISIFIIYLLLTKRLFGKIINPFLKITILSILIYLSAKLDHRLFTYSFFNSYFVLLLLITAVYYLKTKSQNHIKLPMLYLLLFLASLNIRSKFAVSSFDVGLLLTGVVSGVLLIIGPKSKTLISLALIYLLFIQSNYLHNIQYADKTIVFENNRGKVKVEPSPGGILIDTINYLNRSDSKTIAAFPMESSISFFTGKTNSLSSDQYPNGIIPPNKQYLVVEELEKNLPDYITISNYEFLGYFGKDYNQTIYSWILENYKVEKVFGCDRPYNSRAVCSGYGILLYSRKNL